MAKGKKRAIFLLAILLALAVGWLSVTFSRPSSRELNLALLTNSLAGPIVTLEAPLPSYFRHTRLLGDSLAYRIWVYRHKEWKELPLSETQELVKVSPGIVHLSEGRRYMPSSDGATLEVKVPVCKKWTMELTTIESRKVKAFGYSLWSFAVSNRWVSAEIPGGPR
jgi:hypothetical protein